MRTYFYPRNLRAQATLWRWSLKDLAVTGVSALLSVLALAQLHTVIPLAGTAAYAFLTIRLDDHTVLLVLRMRCGSEKQGFAGLNRIEKAMYEQGFDVHRASKPEIRQFLALYFESNPNGAR